MVHIIEEIQCPRSPTVLTLITSVCHSGSRFDQGVSASTTDLRSGRCVPTDIVTKTAGDRAWKGRGHDACISLFWQKEAISGAWFALTAQGCGKAWKRRKTARSNDLLIFPAFMRVRQPVYTSLSRPPLETGDIHKGRVNISPMEL